MGKRNSSFKKIIAIMLCVFIISTLYYSISFVVTHSEHDCHGGSCTICEHITDAMSTIRQLSTSLQTIVNLAFFGAISLFGIFSYTDLEKKLATLVKLKVRMNI